MLRETGEYVVLNHSAALIWNFLGQSEDFEGLLTKLSRLPNSPGAEELKKQTENHINHLISAGFLLEET